MTNFIKTPLQFGNFKIHYENPHGESQVYNFC